jgi:hypothetical protein
VGQQHTPTPSSSSPPPRAGSQPPLQQEQRYHRTVLSFVAPAIAIFHLFSPPSILLFLYENSTITPRWLAFNFPKEGKKEEKRVDFSSDFSVCPPCPLIFRT